MKLFLNIVKIIPITFLVTQVACNSVGNNSSIDKPGVYMTNNNQLIKSNNLKSVSKPLQINVQLTDNGLSSLITMTNPNNYTQTITSDPIITNSAFTLGSNTCTKGLVLNESATCSILINTTNTNKTNQTGNLRIITPTYTYILGLSKAQIIYAAGNFSQASLIDTNFESKISATNSGTCGADGKSACMLVAYDTLNKTLKEIGETSDEIYALTTTTSNTLLVGGAFNSLITTNMDTPIGGMVITKPSNTLIAQINPATNIATPFATADQSVYSFATSPSIDGQTNLGNIYMSGAFTTIVDAKGFTVVKPNGVGGTCTTAQINSQTNNWSGYSYGNGIATSLVATTNTTQPNLDQLLIAGNANNQNNTILNNYTVGVTGCINGNCNAHTPLSLDGTPNVVAGTPDNKMLISGEFSNILGVPNTSNRDVLASGNIQTIGQFNRIAQGDGRVNAILATNNDYFIGGHFSNMNEAKTNGSGYGKCGQNNNNLCALADYNAVNLNTVNLFYTNEDIDAIASGVEFQVIIPQ